jgi:CheY-like chemotaxis protein/HPt (histidine-containing phosphotransfer) domain-containing protein
LQPASLTRAVSVTLSADAGEERVLRTELIENARKDAKILVVEDHPINQQLIAKQLDLLGYACEVHDNGEQGLLAWKSAKFDAIITDCHMPVMDGYTMAQSIREAEAESSVESAVPVIALTASAMTGEAGKCLAAGMSDYLSKPVQLETIRRKLDYWLAGKPNDRRVAQRAREKKREHGRLNLTYLEDTFKDTEQRVKMLEGFVHSNQKDFRALENAVSTRDAALVKDIAHRIKGAAKIMAAEKICLHSEQLESMAAAANWGEVADVLARLAGAMANFENDVTMWAKRELEVTS